MIIRSATVDQKRQRAIAARDADRALAAKIIRASANNPAGGTSRITTGAIRFTSNHR